MLVAQIADQLGNQLFTYASVKTIAQDRGEEFRFIRADNRRVNDNDAKYGNELQTMFPNVKKDFLTELPDFISHRYHEPPMKERKTNFQESALHVPSNTLMQGHFISCRYFSHNMDNVIRWFAFPEEVERQVAEELGQLHKKYPGKALAAVHFRVGADYRRQGFRIRDRYWTDAAEYLLKSSPDTVFLLFYDRKEPVVGHFMKKYPSEICRGSLTHDLCMMSKCEKQIVCNSTFSIMSGVLNQVPGHETVRPSAYPCGACRQPQDCFPEEWHVIPARQSFSSRCQYQWMCLKGALRKLIKSRGKR